MKMQKNLTRAFEESYEVVEVIKDKVLVNSCGKKIVAKTYEKLNKGENVFLYKQPFVSNLVEVLIYLIPLFMFFLGFGFGFFFVEELYHYILVVCLTFFGFGLLFLFRVLLSKLPQTKYVAIKENINILEVENENNSKR